MQQNKVNIHQAIRETVKEEYRHNGKTLKNNWKSRKEDINVKYRFLQLKYRYIYNYERVIGKIRIMLIRK